MNAPADPTYIPDDTLPATLYRPGRDPEADAWFTAFYIENHLDHFTNPDHAATPEQVRFMVYTEGNERYYPCTEELFAAIMARQPSPLLQSKYRQVLDSVLAIIDRQIADPVEKQFLAALTRIKFEHETQDSIIIPSRLVKRLLRIFINHTQIEDPWLLEKQARNRRAAAALQSDAFREALNRVFPGALPPPSGSLTALRDFINRVEIERLLSLTAARALWSSDAGAAKTTADYLALFDRPLCGNGVEALFSFLGIPRNGNTPAKADRSRQILWLADEAGEVMVDLAIIRFLNKLGHNVLIAFKEGPLFTKVDFNDVHEDPVLRATLQGAATITNRNLGTNDLAAALRSDHYIYVVSDGTFETLNLALASTTFARIFKEVDAVVSRGPEQRRRFFDVHFRFTQDIFSICPDDTGAVCIDFKAKHPAVIKFAHADLEKKAGVIVERMRAAKREGMTVIFYSGIIGSIPGRIDMAKKIMSVFIDFLENQSAHTFIINPSKYYEPGMDADDLMYMWEIVQRSGLIDIWRFQTYDDITEAFEIMGRQVPPEWVGKDATFSTGCTKEMRIALDVQQLHPEMQIIGPSKEKFMRRDEYGIGMMYDRRLSDRLKKT